jgi:hypothetical protein
VIDDHTPWVRDYAGLWGLDTQDPLGGERAPAGPRYERSGRVRPSWSQPVAWAGLDKVPATPAPDNSAELIRGRLLAESDRVAADLAEAVPLLRAAADCARAWGAQRGTGSAVIDQTLQQRVADLRRRQQEIGDALVALDRVGGAEGPLPGPHDHLRSRALPLTDAPAGSRRHRLLRLWSAASASLLLGAAGVILLWGRGAIVVPLLVLAIVMLLIEAALRGRLLTLVVNVAVTAVVAAVGVTLLWLALANLRFAVGAVLLLASGFIVWQTLMEGLGLRARAGS